MGVIFLKQQKKCHISGYNTFSSETFGTMSWYNNSYSQTTTPFTACTYSRIGIKLYIRDGFGYQPFILHSILSAWLPYTGKSKQFQTIMWPVPNNLVTLLVLFWESGVLRIGMEQFLASIFGFRSNWVPIGLGTRGNCYLLCSHSLKISTVMSTSLV